MVTSATPLIDTTSATSGTVITSQELAELHSMTHVPTLLAVLSPGVVAQDQNGNPSFGRVTASQVNNARLIELGARLTF